MYLDEPLAEKNFDDLFKNRKQTTMVDPDATAQQRKDVLDLYP
jgi:hypothetical protein